MNRPPVVYVKTADGFLFEKNFKKFFEKCPQNALQLYRDKV